MVVAATLGIVIGFLGSIPLAGPIAAVILRRCLDGRWRQAMAVAAGAAVAEGLYAGLALAGVAAVLDEQPGFRPLALAVVAGLLAILGIRFLRAPIASPAVAPSSEQTSSMGHARRRGFLLGFTLTAANPSVITAWLSMAALLTASAWVEVDVASAWALGLGVVVGVLAWFIPGIALLRRAEGRLTPRMVCGLMRAMGVLLLCGSAWATYGLVRQAFLAPSEAGLTTVEDLSDAY